MAGNDPIVDTMILTRGADFEATYQRAASDPAIAAGTTARIEITEDDDLDSPILATWVASTVTADVIGFVVQSDATDLVADGTHYRLMIRFPGTPNPDRCWYRGPVRRKQ